MAADKNTIVTHHSDGTTTTEVVDWTPEQLASQAEAEANAWKGARINAYPPHADYLDGIVKGDQAQVDKYIADCLAVKALYPKGGA
jgi:hypothetical protein